MAAFCSRCQQRHPGPWLEARDRDGWIKLAGRSVCPECQEREIGERIAEARMAKCLAGREAFASAVLQ